MIAIGITPLMLSAACGGEPEATPPDPAESQPAASVDPIEPPPVPVDPAEAQPTPVDDDLFAGQTLTFVVGFSPGGGYDTNARITAQVLKRYLPGEPEIVVQNLPGAGGLRGKREVSSAEPDGLTFGFLHGRYTLAEILGEDVEGFDPFQIELVGTAEYTKDTSAWYTRRDLGISSFEELLEATDEHPITSGETEPGFSGARGFTFLELKGFPVRTLYGYGGTSEIQAAVDRGELDGTTRGAPNAVGRLYPEWLEEPSFVTPILQYGQVRLEDDEEIADAYNLSPGDVQHIDDLIDDGVIEATPAEQEALRLFGELSFSKTLFLPPGTPRPIVQAYRGAFNQMVADEEFLAMAAAQGVDIGVADGEQMERLLRDAGDMDPETKAFFTRLQDGE